MCLIFSGAVATVQPQNQLLFTEQRREQHSGHQESNQSRSLLVGIGTAALLTIGYHLSSKQTQILFVGFQMVTK